MPSDGQHLNVGFVSSQYELGLGQALGDGTVQGNQNQPMLACFNEAAAKAYQCPVDTTCCGSGDLGGGQSWNKCCMAGNSDDFTLNMWATLGICMGALVLLAVGLILYVERRRRGAMRKEGDVPGAADIEAGMNQMKLQTKADPLPKKATVQKTVPTDAPHKVIPTKSGNIVVGFAPPLPGKRSKASKNSVSGLTIKNRTVGSPQRQSPAQESDSSPGIPTGVPESPISVTPESALSRMPPGYHSPDPASPISSYPNSPGSAPSSSSPASTRSASTSQRRSRFAGSERRALGEIDTNSPPPSTTPGACVNIGSTICQPSAERFKGKENQ